MKKLLLSLFVLFVGIISFCSAGSFTYNGVLGDNGTMLIPQKPLSSNVSVHCDFIPSVSTCEGTWQFKWNITYLYGNLPSSYGNSTSQSSWITNDCSITTSFDTNLSNFEPPSWASPVLGVVSFNISSIWVPDGISINYTCTFNGDFVYSPGGSCPEINTGEILSGYILESEIDTNYCVGNGLCPNECGSGTDLSGDLQYSNLYINSILHPGEENIFIDIPDYIQWDYSVTTGEFNIYVGSGYDMDYMNSIIKINSYRPTSSDFTNIFVSGLTLIFPYIFVLLLIIFMWKLIKRIFK